MKKVLIATLSLLLLLPVSSIYAQDVNQVIIRQNEQSTGSETLGPRTPTIVPISCYVDSNLGIVSFAFTYDFGEVSIDIENQDTGALVSTVVETADGGVMIPFSAAPGLYFISILTESGTEYVGEFEI